jgi:3',5'-cyclic AMP phosphodiesterase CpdA
VSRLFARASAIALLAATVLWAPPVPTLALADAAARAQETVRALPRPESLKFAVLGDAGTGERPQYEIGERMWEARGDFPFEFVILLGDNTYGRPDLIAKFQQPYRSLLDAGVRFFATLGNHDDPASRFYSPFNMGGERYYSFVREGVRFVVLDTNQLDRKQLGWAENTLRTAPELWKIVYFHHALYSNAGRHGSNVELRVVLEPLLIRYGVSVVFAGHDHIYERLEPQKGITYFVQGASGQLRKGDLRRAATTAAGFDQDQSFMLVEISGDQMRFKTISRTGATVDSGVIGRRPTT